VNEAEAQVKCPKCSVDLLTTIRHKILDDDEDTRVLELMKREEADLQRKLLAEDKWTATLKTSALSLIFQESAGSVS
jgi:hypothetical protein